MSPRLYVAVVGGFITVAALVFLVGIPISARDSAGTSVSCGTALKADDRTMEDYLLHQRQLEFAGGYTPPTPPDCDGDIGRRRMWTIPLGLAGLVVAGGAAVVRRPNQTE